MLSTSWEHPPTSSLLEGHPPTSICLARKVSTSHDKSLPRTTSLCLARQDSVPRELPLTPTGAWTTTRGASLGRKRLHHDTWGTDSPQQASAPASGLRKQMAPTRALMQVCPAAQPSHRHHLQLCHTQASPEALKHPLRRAPAYGKALMWRGSQVLERT
jgi:hypothetical protein